MITLNYQIEISANAEKIWSVLTELDKYKQWAIAFSPDSQFSGQWLEGESVSFFDPNFGGTRALIDRVELNKAIEYHHIAIFSPDHLQDIDSDVAKKWIGCRETYDITPLENSIILKVTIETHPDFVNMFNSGWQQALPLIKLVSEQDDGATS
ncbi:SRPBCC family protein [Vibrio sonorensis]|uniref:SRPBCC family protein n=1 Tax=Vibrio sonorensis TaxID=1004316 RepID=UPI0008DB01FB|nr:SRPBCC domain-containing protein [Vibrio sonorensis]